MLLSNLFSNKLDNLANNSDKADVISCCQTKNAISSWLPDIGRNKVANHSEIEEETLEKNSVAGHSKIEEEATEKNGVAEYSKREEKI